MAFRRLLAAGCQRTERRPGSKQTDQERLGDSCAEHVNRILKVCTAAGEPPVFIGCQEAKACAGYAVVGERNARTGSTGRSWGKLRGLRHARPARGRFGGICQFAYILKCPPPVPAGIAICPQPRSLYEISFGMFRLRVG